MATFNTINKETARQLQDHYQICLINPGVLENFQTCGRKPMFQQSLNKMIGKFNKDTAAANNSYSTSYM